MGIMKISFLFRVDSNVLIASIVTVATIATNAATLIFVAITTIESMTVIEVNGPY